MRELALFAGAGGGILGGMLLGWRTVCAVEIDEYCRKVLMQRQDDGHLHPFPIWDDVTTFDGTQWRGCVDVVSGGFPCQDISAAGRGAGIEGSRSGLWSHMARIIGEVRPRYVFVENSPLLVRRGLAVVLGDLAEMGFDARWCVLGADCVGYAHHRARLWLVANAPGDRLEGRKFIADEGGWNLPSVGVEALAGSESRLPISDPRAFGNRYGVAREVDRLRAIGNGQVPAVAAAAWRLLGGPVTCPPSSSAPASCSRPG